MFDQLVVSSSAKRRKTRLAYFTVTAAVWIAALALVVVGGVLSHDARLNDTTKFISLAQPPPMRGNPHPQEQKRDTPQQARQQSQMVAQVKPPDRLREASRTVPPPLVIVADSRPSEPRSGNDSGGGGAGGKDGVAGGIEVADYGKQVEPPKPEAPIQVPVQPQPQPRTQVLRSGGVLQGTATRRVNPVYPQLARAARVSGVVVVEVVVDQAGSVTSTRALSGHALLREAAAAAAMQWKWNPTLLSGVPVQVVGTITFNFTL